MKLHGLLTPPAALLLGAALALTAAPASASSPSPTPSASGCASPASSDLCEQQAALQQTHDKLTANLQAAQAAAEQLRQSLAANGTQQDDVRRLIAQSDRAIADLDASIARLDTEIEATRARIALERQRLAAIERALYRVPDSPLLAIMQAGSLREALLEVGDIASAGVRAEQLKRGLEMDQARLDREVETQRADRGKQAAIRADRLQQLDRLEQLRREQEVTSGQLTVKIAQTQNELRQLDAQSAALATRIAAQLELQQEAIIAAAVQQAWEQTTAWLRANPVGTISLSAGHSTKFRFIWPEPAAQISQGYGPTDLVLEPAYDGYPHFHTGLDLVEADLSPIYAADDGVVAAVGSGTTGYGNYVVLAHAGGLLTLYGHLSQATVKVGEVVVQGQPLGLEGSSGNSTGPHLHFEVRISGQPVDPAPYLPPGPSPSRE